jgi:Mg2+-importing ATPase
MILFGPVSSIFDFITFAVLLHFFRASEEMFHTGWFLESLITEVLVIYVIRTSKWPFFQSRPSPFLLGTGIFVVAAGFAAVHSPIGRHFGFVAPLAKFYAILCAIVTCYLLLGQSVKGWYVKKYGY